MRDWERISFSRTDYYTFTPQTRGLIENQGGKTKQHTRRTLNSVTQPRGSARKQKLLLILRSLSPSCFQSAPSVCSAMATHSNQLHSYLSRSSSHSHTPLPLPGNPSDRPPPWQPSAISFISNDAGHPLMKMSSGIK